MNRRKTRKRTVENLMLKWKEIRLLTGDIRKPIYRDIVGKVYSNRLDIDGESCIEVYVKVTENGPKVVGKQVWYYDGSDDGMHRNRVTIRREMEWEAAVNLSRRHNGTVGLPREFVNRTDGNVHTVLVPSRNGYVVEVSIEMTRYCPIIRRRSVIHLTDFGIDLDLDLTQN